MQLKYNDKLTPVQKASINNFKSYLSKPSPVVKKPISEPVVEPAKEHVHLHDLMLPREVAEYLSLSPMTIKRWSNKGILKCIIINSRGDRRYLRSEINKLLGGTK